jgi:lysophospholipase L1-like esterase
MLKSIKYKLKFIIFCFAPTVVILLTAEIIFRVASLDRPSLHTLQFFEEEVGLLHQDYELFWSNKPNLNIQMLGVSVRTNSLGLRSPEILPKKIDEFRILSLGESTTFGLGVSNSKTYSALMQKSLKKKNPSKNITVINAGVNAYSSFQSIKYLQLRGLKLKPDLILFYHELNDYLPSSVRDSSNTEIGTLKTDQQLFDSRIIKLNRLLVHVSALYRFFSYRHAYKKIQSINDENIDNPLLSIGLPDFELAPRLFIIKNQQQHDAQINEKSIGRRVSEKERLENFNRLLSICNSHNIHLIIIHPAYKDTMLHRCLLTSFCQRSNTLMFEAYNSLHHINTPPGHLYLDSMHPNREGHFHIAKDLTRFICDKVFKLGNIMQKQDCTEENIDHKITSSIDKD